MPNSRQFMDDYEKLLDQGLIQVLPPSQVEQNQTQWAGADMNLATFYFKIENRDKISKLLEPSGYHAAFLALKCNASDLNKKIVYFWAVRGEIELKDFEASTK